MARYDLPTTVNWSEGLGELPKYVNDVTGGIFTNFLLLTTFIIFVAGYYSVRRDIFGAFAVGSFITWLLSVLAFIGDFAGILTIGITTALMFLSFIALALPRSD